MIIKTNLTQQDNPIIQTYFTSLMRLKLDDGFLESEHFENLEIESSIKKHLRQIRIRNQGCVLMVLYSLLVVPREIIQKELPDEYKEINVFLRSETKNTRTTYKSDQNATDFLRHIRNAVSHAKVAFSLDGMIAFEDQSPRGEEFYTELPLVKSLPEFLTRLQTIHLAYLRDSSLRP